MKHRSNSKPGGELKILHVIPSLSRHDGGPTRALWLMQRALAQEGVTIDIATTDDDGPGKRLQVIPADAHCYYFPKRLDFYKVAPAFARWIAANVNRYDVVHIHALFSFVSVVAARAAARAGVPYILRPLGTLNGYGIGQRRPWLKQWSLRLLEGPLLRKAAHVHFTAEAEQLEAAQLGIPLNPIVVPLGLEPFVAAAAGVLSQEFPALAKRRYLLFLSRLDPKKNIEGLLQAFALVSQVQPELLLVVAGSGEADYVRQLQELAARLGVQASVSWPGFVEGAHKAALLGAAELFVLPSFSENFGIAAAEALMASLPCVLGEGVALAAAVQSAGAGVAVVPEPQAIADALLVVLTDREKSQAMAVQALKLAQRDYSVAAMGQRLLELYQQVATR